jgi:hypothetical protein
MQVMKDGKRKLSAVVTLCALLAPACGRVLAQERNAQPAALVYGASNGKVVGIGVGVAAVGALIGIGVFYGVKHNHSVTGCALSGPDGITLTSDSDKQTYTLIGDMAGIKPGNRVRVSGKRRKASSAATRQYLVEKVSRDFGPCELASLR